MDYDYTLREALANEQRIDISKIRDRHVKRLPTDVKARCLQISQHLQDRGIPDDPVARLKRQAKLHLQMEGKA